MPETAERDRSPRKGGGVYKYIFIAVCVAVAWYVVRTETRPEVRATPGSVAASGKPVALTAGTFEQAVAKGVHVVDFWAEWCGPCRTQGPILDRFARSHAGTVGVGKVDVDNEGELAQNFDIHSIPTIIVFKDGREEERFVGVASEETLAAAVRNLL